MAEWGLRFVSEELYAGFGTFADLFLRPYRSLNLTDVGFVEQEHAQAALSDASADGVGQTAFDEHPVEGELKAVGASTDLKLLDERFGADSYAHRGDLEGDIEHGIPEDYVAVEAVVAVLVERDPVVFVQARTSKMPPSKVILPAFSHEPEPMPAAR